MDTQACETAQGIEDDFDAAKKRSLTVTAEKFIDVEMN